jgi:hypothetical protein
VQPKLCHGVMLAKSGGALQVKHANISISTDKAFFCPNLEFALTRSKKQNYHLHANKIIAF